MRSTLNRTITVAQRRWTRPAPTTVTRRLLGDLVSRSANRETMKTLKRLIAATGPASASTQEARLHPASLLSSSTVEPFRQGTDVFDQLRGLSNFEFETDQRQVN